MTFGSEMDRKRTANISAFRYRRIVTSLVSLVVVPTMLLLIIGMVLLFLGEAQVNVLLGIFVMALSGATATGVVLVWVFVRKEANLSRLQSDFVSKVSHELRTPLTSIRLFSETLALRRGDEVAEEQCIRALDEETRRLQELIDRLLDWGKMESGRREFDLQPTEMKTVVATAEAAFSAVRERLALELVVQMENDLPLIVADQAAVADALLNLLTNAAKYGGRPPEVRLSCYSEGEWVCVSVRDNGKGIPQSEHTRIFQKFYRVDDRLAREREGSGLGLAIVKHVMKAHGGRVSVESEPGRGSCFVMRFKIGRQHHG